MAFREASPIESYVVVDERTAAFMALGMSQRSGEPVALVCTSGTALLNYAPAVAEAYYQHIPLIVVSGDRPIEWIDQDDGQTLRQYGALSHVVKRSYDLRAEWTLATDGWYFNRCVNDALLTALSGEKGPVHINLSITEPLTGETDCPPRPERLVTRIPAARVPDEESMSLLSDEFMSARKVLVVAAFMQPDEAAGSGPLATGPIASGGSPYRDFGQRAGRRFIPTIDRGLLGARQERVARICPRPAHYPGRFAGVAHDQGLLRQHKPRAHWRISQGDRGSRYHAGAHPPDRDCSGSLYRSTLSVGFRQSGAIIRTRWHDKERLATRLHDDYHRPHRVVRLEGLFDDSARHTVGTALQLSNGTTVRYAQLFDCPQTSRNDCNRGVCGIDGSTSTAAGASCVDEAMTLFITGDMSFLLRCNGLSSSYLSPGCKVIVMCNGGAESSLYQTHGRSARTGNAASRCIAIFLSRNTPISLACAIYSEIARSAAEVLPRFFAESEQPAILAVHTPNVYNAEVLRGYFRRARS